jgi:hypothetical protein
VGEIGGIDLLDPRCDVVFGTWRAGGPVLLHTGIGLPAFLLKHGSPLVVEELANRYPAVAIVAAHPASPGLRKRSRSRRGTRTCGWTCRPCPRRTAGRSMPSCPWQSRTGWRIGSSSAAIFQWSTRRDTSGPSGGPARPCCWPVARTSTRHARDAAQGARRQRGTLAPARLAVTCVARDGRGGIRQLAGFRSTIPDAGPRVTLVRICPVRST